MTVPTAELGPGYVISRLVKGGWQLAGGHGAVDRERAVAEMAAFADAGITTFDCADIYTGVEEMIGEFLARYRAGHGAAAARRIKVHTKLVPDLDMLARVDGAYVARAVDRSLGRLGIERLDLVQLHWWDYRVPGLVETALHLDDLRRAGKIDLIGGTNFDAVHTAAMLDAGVPLASMQVQYSLLDRRPAGPLAALCRARGPRLLCYGALAGGFMDERWLGAPDPAGSLTNRSLVKYRLIIDELGGWARFQDLLSILAGIARRHGATIAGVAIAWVLGRAEVAGVIVGARYADRLPQTLAACTTLLGEEDHAALDELLAIAPGPSGDTYSLERDRDGRHGAIMRYNLNAGAA